MKAQKILITLISAATLLLSLGNSHAFTRQAEQSDPAYIIRTTLEKITTFSSNSDRASPIQLRAFIEEQIIPHFDFNNMAHWITGPYARNMSDKDKTDFKRSLRETFLSSLAKHLGSFDAENTRFRIYPARYRGADEAFVSTTIYRPDRAPVRLDFRMRRDSQGQHTDWKIIDVKANGSSAVLYYRRHFREQLRAYKNSAPRPVPVRPYPPRPAY